MPENEEFTEEMEKELLSSTQLKECLVRNGWIANRIEHDLGEDILVQIYDNNRWSGLSFYVQLKGTDRLDRYSLTTEDCVSYSMKTKKLVRWDGTSLPVVFIVWDTEQRTGVWSLINDVIQELENSNPQWREQDSNTIHLPKTNGLDPEGLRRLRHKVAEQAYPIISKDKSLDLEVGLQIPPTPEGAAFLKELQEYFAEGGEITIPPEFISELTTPEWHQKLFGGVPFSKEAPVFISSRVSDRSTPQRLDVVSPDGESATLPYIDLKVYRQGTKEALVSNKHQSTPLHFTWLFNHVSKSISLKVEMANTGANVQEILDALRFLRILRIPGAKLFITSLDGESDTTVLDAPSCTEASDVSDEFEELVEKLCFIQRKTGVILTMDELTLDSETIQSIEETYLAITVGRIEMKDGDVVVELPKKSVETALQAKKQGKGMRYSTKAAGSRVSILSKEISLGPANWDISLAIPKLNEEELQQLFDNMSDEATVPITLNVIQGTVEFTDWLLSDETRN